MAIKRLGGLSNIYVAPLTSGTYGTPVAITGAKSIEASLKYESVQFYADNIIDYSDYIFNGGEGKLTVAGLTLTEYNTLFGTTVANGTAAIKSTDVAPELAILFERRKLGSAEKVLYVLYACKFAPPSVSAATMEGKVDEEPVELDFTVRELDTHEVFYMLDTETYVAPAEPGINQETAWYTAVQKPV